MTARSTRALIPVVALLLLAACDSSYGYARSFTLEFPAAMDLGELWLREDVNCFTCGTGEERLGRATGTHVVRLPAAHWYVSLRMSRQASALLPFLAHPSLANLGDIDLARSDVRDDDLRHLAGIDLRSIDLSGTAITGEGLRHLRPNPKWIFVHLRGCRSLDPQYLAHFRGWKRSTISVVGHKSDALTDDERRLLEVARQVICDERPENVCGTQIR